MGNKTKTKKAEKIIDTNKEILNIQEVCELTSLARQTIYCEVYKKTIPFIKFGPRLLRFKREEILHWMEHRNETFRPMNQVIAERKASIIEK